MGVGEEGRRVGGGAVNAIYAEGREGEGEGCCYVLLRGINFGSG